MTQINNATVSLYFVVTSDYNSLKWLTEEEAVDIAASSDAIVTDGIRTFGGVEIPAALMSVVRNIVDYAHDYGDDSPYEDERGPIALELVRLR